jgi:hypothetical protein
MEFSINYTDHSQDRDVGHYTFYIKLPNRSCMVVGNIGQSSDESKLFDELLELLKENKDRIKNFFELNDGYI